MAKAVYSFEVSGIQSFILEGGRLADIAAASALIDSLARPDKADLVQGICEAIKAANISFARRAGAALLVFGPREELIQFRAAWTLNLQLCFPGLRFVDALLDEKGSIKDTMRELRRSLDGAKNRFHKPLPLMAPGTRKSPRSGRAVSVFNRHRQEYVDEITATKRRDHSRIEEKLKLRALGSGRAGEIFPKEFDSEETSDPSRLFPFTGENRTIALVHADGNGLGARIIALLSDERDADKPSALRAMSEALAQATELSVQAAFRECVEPEALCDTDGKAVLVVPARPVLVGGDDVTMILRGDVALRWTESFLRNFRETSKSEISIAACSLRDGGNTSAAMLLEMHFGEGLSAGAGVVFASASMPFDQLSAVCESLASHAKSKAKAASESGSLVPDYLSFHRITASALDNYDTILRSELQRGAGRRLTANPYECGQGKSLDILHALARRVADGEFPRGTLREYVGRVATGEVDTLRYWSRFVFVARKRGYWEAFAENLSKLMPGVELSADVEPFDEDGNTPLLDLLAIVAVEA